MQYETSRAFRAALEERLKRISVEQGTPLMRLRKRIVFERCLARLQHEKDSPWILKGGVALEIRLGLQARMTKDLDLVLNGGDEWAVSSGAGEITSMLRRHLERDLNDYFEFIVAEPDGALSVPGAIAFRFNIRANLAGRLFERLHIDVGIGDPVLTPIAHVEGSEVLNFAGIERLQIRMISVEQHFAEKVHAFTKPYPGRINTRVKDLADLCLLNKNVELSNKSLRKAVMRVFAVRATHEIPRTLPDADPSWLSSFSNIASELGLKITTPEQAVTSLNLFWEEVFNPRELQ